MRDGYRCRVCDGCGRGKLEIIVHHRVPGKSVLNLMIALCPACHAKIYRTKAALSITSPLLLKLWREQNLDGREQIALDFTCRQVAEKEGATVCRPNGRLETKVQMSAPRSRSDITSFML